MAEETVKEPCSILMISNDMEWMLAFSKGVQRFFLLNERRVETLEQAEARMQESRPDIVILAVREGLPSMDKLRPIVREKIYPPVPVIVIDSKPEGLDQWIKQGAEYACARRDLLNAVKHVQQLMRVAHFDGTLRGIEKNAKAISDRYERIYHDLPDPVAYVQDGLFIDANPAFLHTFGVKDRAALDELTLMNFVPHKSERGIKALMKKATEKDVVPSERFELQSLSGGKVDVNLSVSGITIHGEPGLQMYFRSAEAGGGGGTGLDPTTSLAGPRVIAASIKQTQERSEPKTVLGYWVYAWIENYREVWQKDGYKAAEIMMKTVADTTRRFLPPSTEISRFTDDGLALWLTGKKEESIKRVNGLIAHLDEVVPENIGRLVHPKAFAGISEITTESSYDDLVSKGFRAVRGLAMSQSSDRVAEPMSGDISRKDERRVNEIQAILDEQRLLVQYQPISALEVDGVPRYADRLLVLPPEGDVEGESARCNATLHSAPIPCSMKPSLNGLTANCVPPVSRPTKSSLNSNWKTSPTALPARCTSSTKCARRAAVSRWPTSAAWTPPCVKCWSGSNRKSSSWTCAKSTPLKTAKKKNSCGKSKNTPKNTTPC